VSVTHLVAAHEGNTQLKEQPAAEPLSDAVLPVEHQAIAPDGSLVRLLVRTDRGSMAHFELGAGEVSRPQRHHTVTEIWYITQGLGQMWRRHIYGSDETVDLRPGVAITIPVGTSFQFRNTGRDPLSIVGVTMPPWPGEGEATEVDGVWNSNLSSTTP
jgi:mannose-6-phosphate isomerase-like protein (cupin superfamily)